MGKSSPHVSSVWKEIQAPAESLGGEGARSLPLPSSCLHHLAQPVEAGWACPVPGVPASPCTAASPAIPPAHHLSIQAHEPGSETPAFEPSWGGASPAPLPWFLSTLESLWGRLQQMELGVCLKPHVESPEGGNGLHLLEAIAWRAEVREPLSGAGRARRAL